MLLYEVLVFLNQNGVSNGMSKRGVPPFLHPVLDCFTLFLYMYGGGAVSVICQVPQL